MHIQVEEDDKPLSHIFRLHTGTSLKPEAEQRNDNHHCITSSRSNVENLIDNLEQRLTVVEATVTNALDGISHIVSVMDAIKKHINVNVEVPPTTTKKS